MYDFETFRPIKRFGLFLIAIGILGINTLFFLLSDSEIYLAAKFFILLASTFHLIIGFNIVSRNKWGFESLKIYLYLIYPGYPLGYYIAKATFNYIKTHNIKEFFNKTIDL